MEIPVLEDLLVVMGISVVVVYGFNRLKLPAISGFLLSGVVMGPGGLGMIEDLHVIELLAEIGVALLLFTIGLEFSLPQLSRIKWLVLGAGLGQMLLTIGAVTGLSSLLGLPFSESVFFGFLFALSSTAIVLKLLGDRRELDSPQGRFMLAVLLFQDLAVVPLMLLTPALGGQGGTPVEVLTAMATSFGVVVAILVLAVWVSPWLLKKVVNARSREIFVLTVLSLSLGTAWLTQQAGLSLALGAFLAGIAISSSEYNHQALTEVLPFRDASSSLFFVSVGMLVYPAAWAAAPMETIGLLLGLILVKALVVLILGIVFGAGVRVAVLAGLGLAQVGEFAFILAKFGQNYKLLPDAHYQTFLSVSVLTMLLTPFALLLASKVAPAASDRLSFLEKLSLTNIVAAEAGDTHHLHDHVIIIGYGLNGRNVAKVLQQSSTPYVIIELNPITVSQMRQKGENIFYGDATRAEVLRHLGIEHAKVLVSVIPDTAATLQIVAAAKHLNPNIEVIARARYMADADAAYRSGAKTVVVEEFETSLEIVEQILLCYQVSQSEVQKRKEMIQREFFGKKAQA